MTSFSYSVFALVGILAGILFQLFAINRNVARQAQACDRIADALEELADDVEIERAPISATVDTSGGH